MNHPYLSSVRFSPVAQLCPTLCDPMDCSMQASLFITNFRSVLKLTSIESVMPSNHLILCRSLLLPSIFPNIRVFSNESVLHIRWPKYWSFSFSISPSNESPALPTPQHTTHPSGTSCMPLQPRSTRNFPPGLQGHLWVSRAQSQTLYPMTV